MDERVGTDAMNPREEAPLTATDASHAFLAGSVHMTALGGVYYAWLYCALNDPERSNNTSANTRVFFGWAMVLSGWWGICGVVYATMLKATAQWNLSTQCLSRLSHTQQLQLFIGSWKITLLLLGGLTSG